MDKDDCIQIYRYRESYYMKGSSLVHETSWTPMRKMSCRKSHENHTRCYGPVDDANESGPEIVEIQCDKPENNKLYRAVFVPGHKDWETGCLDDWHWKMVPYEEETKI